MVFELFTKLRRTFLPRISLRKNGQIGINEPAAQKYYLKEECYAQLYYDKNIKTIGIKNFYGQKAEGSVKIRRRKSGADISAKAFCKYYNIDTSKAKTFWPVYDSEINMIILKEKEQS